MAVARAKGLWIGSQSEWHGQKGRGALVWSISFVWFTWFLEPKKRDKPNEPQEPERSEQGLVPFMSSLLTCLSQKRLCLLDPFLICRGVGGALHIFPKRVSRFLRLGVCL